MTNPGSYRYTAEDDIPTKRENTEPETLTLVRLYDHLNAAEKRRVVHLFKSWHKCSVDQQVIIEAIAREFAPADS